MSEITLSLYRITRECMSKISLKQCQSGAKDPSKMTENYDRSFRTFMSEVKSN